MGVALCTNYGTKRISESDGGIDNKSSDNRHKEHIEGKILLFMFDSVITVEMGTCLMCMYRI